MFDMTNVSLGAVPSGLTMVVAGTLLIWWSNRHNASRELANESKEATVGALTHTPTPARSSKAARRATTSVRFFALRRRRRLRAADRRTVARDHRDVQFSALVFRSQAIAVIVVARR